MLLATDLAEVAGAARGFPSARPTRPWGASWATAAGRGVDIRSLDHSREMRSFHEAFPAAAAELLDLERSFEQRTLAGGTARAQR